MGDGVLLPTAGSPPGAACRASQPHGLAGLCCSQHFLSNKSSGSRAEAPVGALPPPDPPPCPPTGSGTSLFPHGPFQHAPPRPILPAGEQLAVGALPARAAGATVSGAGRWLSGGVAGSPGQKSSLLMVASFSKEFQNGGSSACLPIARHGYALPYFSPGSDSPF